MKNVEMILKRTAVRRDNKPSSRTPEHNVKMRKRKLSFAFALAHDLKYVDSQQGNDGEQQGPRGLLQHMLVLLPHKRQVFIRGWASL